MNRAILPALVLLLTVASCQKASTTHTEGKDYEINKAAWLIGRWENNGDTDISEIWVLENDSTMLGAMHVVFANDTVFSESVWLTQVDGRLSYIVSVPENNDRPVMFKLTSSTDEKLVFENPQHDYPTKIVYRRIGNDSLAAEISGVKDGKIATVHFPMAKVKTRDTGERSKAD